MLTALPVGGYTSLTATTGPVNNLTFTSDGSQAIPFDRGSILRSNTGAAQTSSQNCPGCLQSYLDALATGVERNGSKARPATN